MFHELFRIVIDTSARIALVIVPALPLLGQRLRTLEVVTQPAAGKWPATSAGIHAEQIDPGLLTFTQS